MTSPNDVPRPEDVTQEVAAAKSTGERRASTRVATSREFIRAAWEGADGAVRVGLASLLDVSKGGAALEMPDSPRAGSWIRFECEEASIFGMGRVCYVKGSPGRVLVGVEFSEDTFWRAVAKRTYLTAPKGLRGRPPLSNVARPASQQDLNPLPSDSGQGEAATPPNTAQKPPCRSEPWA